jgi:protocatechuate 3,4-dioxygenase beta subunit
LRRDITEGRPGFPLQLRLTIRDVTTCAPIAGAEVELWHCDAAGTYSGVGADAGTFLRGQQLTNRKGRVLFDTIYPGWYPGRTPHIHVRVHTGGTIVHTGQLYFEEDVTSAVYEQGVYAPRGAADTSNAADFIYANGGAQSTLGLRKRRRGVRGKIVLAVEA